MRYAKIERHDYYGIVVAILDTTKTLNPPRYIDIGGTTPEPTVGDYYNPASGVFTSQPPQAVRNTALLAVITALEDAGLVTRTF